MEFDQIKTHLSVRVHCPMSEEGMEEFSFSSFDKSPLSLRATRAATTLLKKKKFYWQRKNHWIFQSLNESVFSLNTVTDLSKVWTNHCKLIACMQSLSRVRSQVACFNFRSKDLTCLKNLAILSCHTNFRLKPETLTVDQWPLPLYLDYKS